MQTGLSGKASNYEERCSYECRHHSDRNKRPHWNVGFYKLQNRHLVLHEGEAQYHDTHDYYSEQGAVSSEKETHCCRKLYISCAYVLSQYAREGENQEACQHSEQRLHQFLRIYCLTFRKSG